jgi:hypothetical protein
LVFLDRRDARTERVCSSRLLPRRLVVERFAKLGGIAASVILIILGVGSVVIGAKGHSDVRDEIAQEEIVGTPDMSPDAIETTQGQEVPDCDVADEEIDTGDEARCFADYLRIHALESTGGLTYAELPRFLDEEGQPTEDEAAAAIDPETGEPSENPVRETWVSATAFTTALNTSYFAEQVARFGIAMGVAMILIGFGFAVLVAFGAVGPGRSGASRT